MNTMTIRESQDALTTLSRLLVNIAFASEVIVDGDREGFMAGLAVLQEDLADLRARLRDGEYAQIGDR